MLSIFVHTTGLDPIYAIQITCAVFFSMIADLQDFINFEITEHKSTQVHSIICKLRNVQQHYNVTRYAKISTLENIPRPAHTSFSGSLLRLNISCSEFRAGVYAFQNRRMYHLGHFHRVNEELLFTRMFCHI